MSELETILKLRSMRKQVSLQALRQLDVKSHRRQVATLQAQTDLAEAEVIAERFIAQAMAAHDSRSCAATFFSSLALGHRYAQLAAQTKRQQLDRLLHREEAVRLEREALARVYLRHEQRHDQIADIAKETDRAHRALRDAAVEQEQQDLHLERGGHGTS